MCPVEPYDVMKGRRFGGKEFVTGLKRFGKCGIHRACLGPVKQRVEKLLSEQTFLLWYG
jgi:hypothetical protein